MTFMAHLLTENGALAEDIHGDNNCSIGMIQWNLCAHEGMKVDRWLALHPEWADWEFQIRFYLDEMTWRLEKYESIDRAILSWNPGAGWAYVSLVKSRIDWAVRLMGE